MSTQRDDESSFEQRGVLTEERWEWAIHICSYDAACAGETYKRGDVASECSGQCGTTVVHEYRDVSVALDCEEDLRPDPVRLAPCLGPCSVL